MAHFTLIRSPVTNWSTGSTVLASEIQTLDSRLLAAITADAGGCWAPVTPIVISGAGIQCSGLLTIARGGTLTTGATNTIQIGGNGTTIGTPFPRLSANHVGRTRIVLEPCMEARGVPRYLWKVRHEDVGLQAYAPMFDDSSGAGPQVARAYMPFRAHHAATLSKITITFRVGYPHTQLPGTMPQVRVLRMDTGGNCTPMTSQTAGADVNGYVAIPKPTNVTAWNNALQPQKLVVTCDQNNVIDVQNYDYLIELVDEQGLTGYPWTLVYKKRVQCATTGPITSLYGFLTVDGYTVVAGDRILVKDQQDPTENCIYFVTKTGGWYFDKDMHSASDFTQGFCVRVENGNVNGASTWQASTAIISWDPHATPLGLLPWQAGATTRANDPVKPTFVHANGLWYTATVGGLTGPSEPAWPLATGQTVIDNAVTWQCSGALPAQLTFAARPPGDYPAEGSGYLAHGLVWHSALVEYDSIGDTNFP